MSTNSSSQVIPKKFLLSFCLVTVLFSLWGFANDFTNPLVSVFKDVFVINNLQSSWVQMAFYGGYATMAIPAALLIQKFSYRFGILTGLSLFAIGTMLTIPASASANFNLFIGAIYILTFGLAFLETTANPYILAMGSESTATQRLNLAQAFNPIGSLTGMVIVGTVVLSNIEVVDFKNDVSGYKEELSTVKADKPDLYILPFLESKPRERKNDAQVKAYVTAKGADSVDVSEALKDFKEGTIPSYQGKSHVELQQHDLKLVSKTYMTLGFVVLAVLLVFIAKKLPKTDAEVAGDQHGTGTTIRNLFSNPRYLGGVVAQMFYVGAQIMCWTFIIQYAENELGLDKATAQNHNIMAMVLFLSFRFICTAFLKYVSPGKLLTALAFGGIIFTLGAIHLQGMAGLYSLVLISTCMSLMFPTIYGLALEGIGQDAKLGSAGLILAIVGAVWLTGFQAKILDLDGFMGTTATRGSFYLTVGCFVIIAIYGFLSRNPRKA